jgi:hypothetical protein
MCSGLLLVDTFCDHEVVPEQNACERKWWPHINAFKCDHFRFGGELKDNISEWISNIQDLQVLNSWPGAAIKACLPMMVQGSGRRLYHEVRCTLPHDAPVVVAR